MLHQIIYTSAAIPSATLEDFKAIAEHASRKNKSLGVTGMMLFTDGVIFQVLEGEKDVVEALYDRIARDHRHSGVLRMISRSAEQREFAKWSMGFSEMTIEQVTDLAFMLTKTTLDKALPDAPSSELRILTDTYARVNGL